RSGLPGLRSATAPHRHACAEGTREATMPLTLAQRGGAATPPRGRPPARAEKLIAGACLVTMVAAILLVPHKSYLRARYFGAGADLRKADLSRRDLRRANLAGADLRG